MAAPVLDGHVSAQGSTLSSTALPALTTTGTSDLIVVVSYNEKSSANPSVSSVTGGGLTFTRRKQSHGSTAGGNLEIWTATAVAVLSAVVLTVNYSAAFDDNVVCAFGVSGVQVSAPFDTNASMPAAQSSNSTTGWTPSFSGLNTTFANDFLIFCCGQANSGLPATPTGYTNIVTQVNAGGSRFAGLLVAYKAVTATLSSATVAASSASAATSNGSLEAIFDAITAGSVGSGAARPLAMVLS